MAQRESTPDARGRILVDWEIRQYAKTHGMIDPFDDHLVRDGVISYGLSSMGYDIRVSDEFKIFTNINTTVVDPKHFDPRSFIDVTAESCIIPLNSFALGRSLEYLRLPRKVMGICIGKSTYARCGIVVNITPLECEWEGHLIIEISNTTPLPAKIYNNDGIAQVIFLESEQVCEVSYADRGGKYQSSVVLPFPACKPVAVLRRRRVRES